jgi:hypothetical protein
VPVGAANTTPNFAISERQWRPRVTNCGPDGASAMNFDDLPPTLVPTDLSDATVVAIVDLLNGLIHALKSPYTGQILRYHRSQPRQTNLWA